VGGGKLEGGQTEGKIAIFKGEILIVMGDLTRGKGRPGEG